MLAAENQVAKGMRVLVLGCGSIGRRHIKNLRTLGVDDLIAFDPNADQLKAVSAQFKVMPVESLEQAWSREPQVAVITAPTSFHGPLALNCASHQCHIFVEKPLSHTWEGIERLLELVKENDLISLVGCNMRFHPGLVTVKNLLEDQAVGTVIATRIEVGHYLPDWHPGEDYRRSYSARNELGGGVILDAIHEIDYSRWLLGEVLGVYCLAGKLSGLEIDTEDTAAILLRFSSGVFGEVHLDYIQRCYSRTCQIIGEEGTIHWDYSTGQVRWYSARTKRWKVFSNPPDWEPNQMYMDEMKHFLRCLEGQERSVVDAWEGARALQVALAAKQSAQQNQWLAVGGLTCNSSRTL